MCHGKKEEFPDRINGDEQINYLVYLLCTCVACILSVSHMYGTYFTCFTHVRHMCTLSHNVSSYMYNREKGQKSEFARFGVIGIAQHCNFKTKLTKKSPWAN